MKRIILASETRSFEYSGPYYIHSKYIGDIPDLATEATSKSEAARNFAYQIRKRLHLANSVPVSVDISKISEKQVVTSTPVKPTLTYVDVKGLIGEEGASYAKEDIIDYYNMNKTVLSESFETFLSNFRKN